MRPFSIFFLLCVTNLCLANSNKSTTLHVKQLLYQHEYIQLNQFLEELQDKTQKDISNEIKLYAAYRGFEFADTKLKHEISQWISKTPNNYQPYLARSFYYFAKAWQERGKKWASETKKKQFEKMQIYLEKAKNDIKKVAKINQKLTLPLYMQIRISNALGDEQERNFLDKAIEIDKRSYQVRKVYLQAITPRWGGSIKLMQKYIEEIRPLFQTMQHLKPLQGLPFMEVAKIQYSQKIYSGAIRLYTKALTFGDNHYAYFKRGRAYYKRDEYEKALADMNKAIELYPEDGDYYYYRAFIYYQENKIEEDITDTLMALQFNPYDDSYLSHRDDLVAMLTSQAEELTEAGKTKQALTIYNKIITINPEYARNYALRALALIKLNHPDQAEQDIYKALKIEPETYYYYSLLDWSLTKRKEWQKIINYWDKYISLKPSDDRAYVAQSGAYYHLGNIRKALELAKKAADMGNAQGLEIYNKYKHLL